MLPKAKCGTAFNHIHCTEVQNNLELLKVTILTSRKMKCFPKCGTLEDVVKVTSKLMLK